MKILFVIPRLRSMYGDYGIKVGHPHVGVAYLCSWLKSKGVEVQIFDDGIHLSYEKLISTLKNNDANLIGITMFSYCYQSAYNLIEKIKKNTKVPLVVGGPHVSNTKKQILEETAVDFAIKQEGEKPLFKLLQFVSKQREDYENIDGLIWRNRTKGIIENKDEQFLVSEELNKMPLPDYEAFNLKQYLCTELNILPLITSRGCPYKCNFCSVCLGMGRNFRPRSAENVFKEIKYWYAKGWKNFDINDDCFTVDMQRANDICDMIINSEIDIKLNLYNGVRPDRIDYNLLKKLKKAGCIFLSLGCESGNDRVLRGIRKGLTTAEVYNASRWARSLTIKHSVNFIIGHTDETYKEAMDSIYFAKRLPCDFVNFYNLVPYPNTDAYFWVKRNGKFLVNENNYLKHISYRDNIPIFETAQFSRAQRMKVARLGFNLYERKVLQFRLGKFLGTFGYYLTRLPFMHQWALKIMGTKTGGKLFLFLSGKSRQ